MPGATVCVPIGAGVAGTVKLGLGGESSGAPTSMSQRCPGWPCAGFKATAVPGVLAWFAGLVAGAVVVVFSVLPESEQLIKVKNKAATANCDAIFMMLGFMCGIV